MLKFATNALIAAGLMPNYARAAASGAAAVSGSTATGTVPVPVPPNEERGNNQLSAALMSHFSPGTQAAVARHGLAPVRFCARCWTREAARAGHVQPDCETLGHNVAAADAVTAVRWSKDGEEPIWVAVRPPPVSLE